MLSCDRVWDAIAMIAITIRLPMGCALVSVRLLVTCPVVRCLKKGNEKQLLVCLVAGRKAKEKGSSRSSGICDHAGRMANPERGFWSVCVSVMVAEDQLIVRVHFYNLVMQKSKQKQTPAFRSGFFSRFAIAAMVIGWICCSVCSLFIIVSVNVMMELSRKHDHRRAHQSRGALKSFV